MEDRQLLSGLTMAGLGIFLASNRALFDPPPQPPASAPVQVTTVNPVVVDTTAANPAPATQPPVAQQVIAPPAQPVDPPVVVNGTPDSSTSPGSQAVINPPGNGGTATRTEQISFGSATTDWSRTQGLNQFNSTLGTLTEVELVNSGSLTSRIRVESLDCAPAHITGMVSGDLTLTGAGMSPLVTSTNAETESFNAGAYDGTTDFAGTSGQDFGSKSSGGSKSLVLTNPADLARFIGSGQIALTETAHATSSADGAGNLLTQINSTAQAQVTAIYHYVPAPVVTPPPNPGPGVQTPPEPPLSKRMFLASSFRLFM